MNPYAPSASSGEDYTTKLYPAPPQSYTSEAFEQADFFRKRSPQKPSISDGPQMHHANTCLTKLGELQGRLYKHFAQRGDQSTGWNVGLRLVLPGVALALTSATLTLAFKVGAVAEVTLKGLGNILGGIFLGFFPKCDIERGLNMLVTELPVSLFKLGISIAIEIPVRGAITVIAMIFYPSSYCKIECKDHKSTHEMLENASMVTKAQKEKFKERRDVSFSNRIARLTNDDWAPKVLD